MATRPNERPDQVGRRPDVLDVLKSAGTAMTIAQIADRLDVHPNTVRFHLDTLVGNGQVERVRPEQHRPGRPAQVFQAVRTMDPGGPRHYQLLAEILAANLAGERNPGARAVAAGRAWGRTLTGPQPRTTAVGENEFVDHLVSVLDQLGFAPEVREAAHGKQVGLRHCPFLELAESRAAVVCPIHLGLMQGAMGSWGAPVTVDRLEAFAEPDLCLAHLAPARSAS